MLKNMILAALLSTPFFSLAQTSRWSLRADLYRPKGVVSFKNPGLENAYHQPMNYGFALGAERNWKQNERFRFYQTAVAGFYHHVYFEKVFTLETHTGFDFRIWRGLHAGFELGAGAHQARSSDVRYKYENGKWTPTREGQDLTNRFALGGNLQLGCRFGARMDVFAALGAVAIMPLLDIPEFGYPFFAYGHLRVGARRRF
jgi:hypothetical protein